ncbi:PREDICTED: B-cell receptor-associated protein 31 [Ceratosolen solmsi marchali]|uniref:Endoplasmic reticulum transmembrane protein n=1 Tax=Ceratosolen solmsi marchali TaxID=326594 RepID=A0AAJ6YQ07_9HYME|nr:PREDICTED: B-cell receptor-associated protein 31 [Ceratosolen solmsi marchali]XP_011502098.1 PREDICTED: B-cell receptor-associated protein 31 [Ceratosolen solmsi marchali]
MSFQWMLIAAFLYAEIFVVLLLVLPVASPQRWHRFFKSRFLKSLGKQASIYFFVLLATLVLFLIDAIREIRKYSSVDASEHTHLDAEMQGNMRLFRAQRNFYISGFALFLSLVIRRLVILISTLATLSAESEASMKQAKSAMNAAKSLLQQSTKTPENEKNDQIDVKLKHRVEELEAENDELKTKLEKETKDKLAMKSQAESLGKEYDKLNTAFSALTATSGDKKSD